MALSNGEVRLFSASPDRSGEWECLSTFYSNYDIASAAFYEERPDRYRKLAPATADAAGVEVENVGAHGRATGPVAFATPSGMLDDAMLSVRVVVGGCAGQHEVVQFRVELNNFPR